MALDKSDKPVSQSELLAVITALLDARGLTGANAMTADAIGEALNMAMERSERRTTPSNPNPPLISAFSYPEGERARPKPTFMHGGEPFEVWFNNARLDLSQLTPFEILTVNALRDSFTTTSMIKRARGEKWRCELRAQGRKMYIICPCATEEDRLEVMTTTLVLICKELAEGAAAADPSKLLERVVEMQAQIDALKAAQAPVTAPVG